MSRVTNHAPAIETMARLRRRAADDQKAEKAPGMVALQGHWVT